MRPLTPNPVRRTIAGLAPSCPARAPVIIPQSRRIGPRDSGPCASDTTAPSDCPSTSTTPTRAHVYGQRTRGPYSAFRITPRNRDRQQSPSPRSGPGLALATQNVAPERRHRHDRDIVVATRTDRHLVCSPGHASTAAECAVGSNRRSDRPCVVDSARLGSYLGEAGAAVGVSASYAALAIGGADPASGDTSPVWGPAPGRGRPNRSRGC